MIENFGIQINFRFKTDLFDHAGSSYNEKLRGVRAERLSLDKVLSDACSSSWK